MQFFKYVPGLQRFCQICPGISGMNNFFYFRSLLLASETIWRKIQQAEIQDGVQHFCF